MKHLWTLLAILLAAGCTQKYVSMTLYEGAQLTVNGDIDPSFMREGTTETVSPSVDLEIPLNKIDCDTCHAAYAGDLFRGIQLPDLPDEPDKPVEPPPVVEPVDPVKPPVVEPPVVEPVNQITETCKRNGKGDKNPGWITYYCGHKYEYYPKQITIELPSGKKWTANLGGTRSDRPGEVGQFVRGQYVVKKSSSNGRLTILPARKFVAPAPWEPAIKIHYSK